MKKDHIPTAIENDIKNQSNQRVAVTDGKKENVQYLNMHDSESELSKSIEVLQNPKKVETTTILSDEQVNGIVMMNWAGQVYDIQFFKNYVKSFPLYKISGGDGKGRQQTIEIAKAIQVNNAERDQKILEMFKR